MSAQPQQCEWRMPSFAGHARVDDRPYCRSMFVFVFVLQRMQDDEWESELARYD
jgi:hypothetical protein